MVISGETSLLVVSAARGRLRLDFTSRQAMLHVVHGLFECQLLRMIYQRVRMAAYRLLLFRRRINTERTLDVVWHVS